MKHIIIDTNVIHQDYNLVNHRIMTLSSKCNSLGYKILLPDVVVDEMVKQYTEDVHVSVQEYNKAVKQLNKLVTANTSLLDEKEYTSYYETTLRRRIASLDIGVIPYPNTKHKEMVARELGKRKPFKDSQKGYRDSLIWESIKEYCKSLDNDDSIIFLTENSKDFANKDKTSLHSDLIADCDAIGLNAQRIRLVTDVRAFIDDEIIGKLKELQNILEELRSTNEFDRICIKDVIDEFVNEDLLTGYVTDDPYGENMAYIPSLFENPDITDFEVSSISYDSIHEISDTDILIRCTVEIEIYIDMYIYHADLALIDGHTKLDVFDYEWNEHYAAASDHATFKLRLNIICDKEKSKVLRIDDEVLKVVYGSGYHFEA